MAEQIFQVGIKGLARNDKGEVLMVHIPAWNSKPAYWDLPGGRMNPGETFLETLGRELQEEIGVGFNGTPKQLTTLLTPITISVGDTSVPLILVVYEVRLTDIEKIWLDPDSAEEAYEWFPPEVAATNLAFKFSEEFCAMVAQL